MPYLTVVFLLFAGATGWSSFAAGVPGDAVKLLYAFFSILGSFCLVMSLTKRKRDLA